MPNRVQEAARDYRRVNPKKSGESHIQYRHRVDRYAQNKAGFTSKVGSDGGYTPRTDAEWKEHDQEVAALIDRRIKGDAAQKEREAKLKKEKEEKIVEELNKFFDSFDNGDSITEDTFRGVIPHLIFFKRKIAEAEYVESNEHKVTPETARQVRSFVVRNKELIDRLEKFEQAMAEEKMYSGRFGIGRSFPKTRSGYERISSSVSNAVAAINRATAKIAQAKVATEAMDGERFSKPIGELSSGARAGLGQQSSTTRSQSSTKTLSIG